MTGLELSIVGLGTVFVFLSALVGATTLMSKVLTRLLPPALEPAEEAGPDPRLLAAVTAAVHAHRDRSHRS